MNTKQTSRLTAILILLMAVIAPIGILIIPEQLFVEADMATTILNIHGNTFLFGIMIMSGLLVCILEIAISVLLYRLFENANITLARISTAFRLTMTVIQIVNVLVHLAMPLVIDSPLETEQVNGLVSLLLKSNQSGIYVWQIFFGLHLIMLGILVFQSSYIPKPIGIAVFLASSGYLADSFIGIFGLTQTTLASFVPFLLILAPICELIFTFWLLIKGIETNPKTIQQKL